MIRYSLTKVANSMFIGLAMLFCSFALAQNPFIEYKGKVIDGKSKKELEFVSVTISETNISTVTNSEGEFALKVPEAFKNGMLKISHLGYTTKVLALSTLAQSRY